MELKKSFLFHRYETSAPYDFLPFGGKRKIEKLFCHSSRFPICKAVQTSGQLIASVVGGSRRRHDLVYGNNLDSFCSYVSQAHVSYAVWVFRHLEIIRTTQPGLAYYPSRRSCLRKQPDGHPTSFMPMTGWRPLPQPT